MEKMTLDDCPFCNSDSPVFNHTLEETERFRIVADRHPLIEGHILLIPKEHFCCAGEFPDDVFAEFETLFRRISGFLKKSYGSAAAFERGRIHRTVFHSQVHFLPFGGPLEAVIREGRPQVATLRLLDQLQLAFQEDNGYQFLSIEEEMWLVDPDLAAPKFFRTRFAEATGHPERADWQHMHDNYELMETSTREIEALKSRWKEIFSETVTA